MPGFLTGNLGESFTRVFLFPTAGSERRVPKRPDDRGRYRPEPRGYGGAAEGEGQADAQGVQKKLIGSAATHRCRDRQEPRRGDLAPDAGYQKTHVAGKMGHEKTHLRQRQRLPARVEEKRGAISVRPSKGMSGRTPGSNIPRSALYSRDTAENWRPVRLR
jgi:hypothetical protein